MMSFYWIIIPLISLCVGSFLNVVIYRLPLILKQNWQRECESFLQQTTKTNDAEVSLALPRSHCPRCKHQLRWYHNIPLFSFIYLKGRCAFCQQSIAWQYPLVEISSVIIAILLYMQFGLTLQLLASLVFSWLLIILIAIDFKEQLLPDILTLLLLWLGLLASTVFLFVSPIAAIFGAIVGYSVLWIIAKAYFFITGREGMGHGDFKLLAALGAWLGWQNLCWVVLLASLLGIIVSLLLLAVKRMQFRTPFAFGPYLAISGWIILLWGPVINSFWGLAL